MSTTHDLLIIGAGYVGARMACRALDSPDFAHVSLTARATESLAALTARGATARALDLLEDHPRAIADLITPSTWILYSVPTLYKTHETQGALARHVRPMKATLDVAKERGAAGLIYLSSTSVYGDHGGGDVTEESEHRPASAAGKMREDIEQHLLAREGDLPTLAILRLVGIYGPGRTLDAYIKKGRYKLVNGGEKITNRIHVEDICGAIEAVIARAPLGARAYDLSDGSPLAVRELVDEVVALTGVERPEEISMEALVETRGEAVAARWRSSYRCVSQRAREELGWEPEHANAIEGYRQIFAGGE